MRGRRTRQRVGQGSVSYDSSSTAFFTAVSSAGGTLSDSQKSAIDTYVKGLKSANLWDKFDRLYINVGGNTASHALCLVSLTSRTAVNSPGIFANGGTYYNGSSSYMRCDIAPSGASKATTTNAFAICFFDYTFAYSSDGIVLGASNWSNYFSLEVGLVA